MATDEIISPRSLLDLPSSVLFPAILSKLVALSLSSKRVSHHVKAALHDAQASATELFQLNTTSPSPAAKTFTENLDEVVEYAGVITDTFSEAPPEDDLFFEVTIGDYGYDVEEFYVDEDMDVEEAWIYVSTDSRFTVQFDWRDGCCTGMIFSSGHGGDKQYDVYKFSKSLYLQFFQFMLAQGDACSYLDDETPIKKTLSGLTAVFSKDASELFLASIS
jgi:hypothetical protein